MRFSTLFYQKTPPEPHMHRQKRFRKTVCFPRSPLLCGQNVCAVVGYADTVLAQLFTTQTLCQRSQQLR